VYTEAQIKAAEALRDLLGAGELEVFVEGEWQTAIGAGDADLKTNFCTVVIKGGRPTVEYIVRPDYQVAYANGDMVSWRELLGKHRNDPTAVSYPEWRRRGTMEGGIR